MRALDVVVRELKLIGRALINAPVRAYHYLVDNASRVLAVLWIAGMAFVVIVTVKRIIKLEREEAALVAAVGPTAAAAQPENGDGPEQVVEMMDVDEMNDIQNERMHALGLAAAGDSGDPDQAAIDAARDHRGKTADPVQGDRAGGAGNITVVSKGGIAGWINRNKGKKPDPETLAWLRGEEKADGRAAYAQWADTGDGTLTSWVMNNKNRKQAGAGSGAVAAAGSGAGSAVAIAVVADTGAGSGSGSGSSAAAGSAVAAVAVVEPPKPVPVPAPVPVAPAEPPPLDLYALGAAAVLAVSPTEAVEHRRAALAALRGKLAGWPATKGLEAQAHGRHVSIPLPEAELFGADGTPELTANGKLLVRRLGAIIAASHDGDVEVRGAADRAIEIASQFAIAGLAIDRIALVATDPIAVAAGSGSDAALEVVLLEAR